MDTPDLFCVFCNEMPARVDVVCSCLKVFPSDLEERHHGTSKGAAQTANFETIFFLRFWWFLGPSDQNELYHTPLLSKRLRLRQKSFCGAILLSCFVGPKKIRNRVTGASFWVPSSELVSSTVRATSIKVLMI